MSSRKFKLQNQGSLEVRFNSQFNMLTFQVLALVLAFKYCKKKERKKSESLTNIMAKSCVEFAFLRVQNANYSGSFY